jgi:hypothetical protein
MPATAARRILLLGTENSDGTVTGVTTGTSQPIDCSGLGVSTVYLRSVGTTSSGTVLVEGADWGPLETIYSGTWATIASIAASTFTGGAQTQVSLANSSQRWVRVRISSGISGGGTMLASISQQGGGA